MSSEVGDCVAVAGLALASERAISSEVRMLNAFQRETRAAWPLTMPSFYHVLGIPVGSSTVQQ